MNVEGEVYQVTKGPDMDKAIEAIESKIGESIKPGNIIDIEKYMDFRFEFFLTEQAVLVDDSPELVRLIEFNKRNDKYLSSILECPMRAMYMLLGSKFASRIKQLSKIAASRNPKELERRFDEYLKEIFKEDEVNG